MNSSRIEYTVQDFIEKGEAELETGPFGTQLKASEYVDKGIPVINVRNIGFGKIREEKLEHISEETAQRLSQHLLEPSDIVFARKGAVERHAFIRERHRGWFQGSDCLRLRIRSPLIEPRFLSYYLLTDFHKKWIINQCSHGATMASLNQEIISRIPIRLPPLNIQRKIVAVLSAYDDLIENNTQRINVLEEVAHMLYREWFVHFRFPGHEGKQLVSSKLGMIPEGWKVKRLEEVTENIVLGGTPSRNRAEYWERGTILWIKSGKLNDIRVIEGSETITSLGLDSSAAKLMPKRTVLIAITGKILISLSEIELCANQSVIGIYGSKGLSQEYIYLYETSNINQFISKMSGSAQQHVNKEIVCNSLMLVPNSDIMNRFGEIAKPIFDLISKLLFENKNLEQIRDLLLPKLVLGEVDVSGLDIPGD